MSAGFVFENPQVLATVCGPNDMNIDYLEHLLGCSLAVRGNRIEYSGDDEKTVEIFNALLPRLQRLASISEDISQPEILMEFKALEAEEGKDPDSEKSKKVITIGTRSVYPKSKKQEEYINAMENSQIVFAVGPAGTGKTFLAVSYCLAELLSGRKHKIILTRPVVEAGESLGFLPGDLSQKLNPYLKPLYDSMEATLAPSTVKRLEETGQIEIAPLAYMRGRSITNSCIILDEAQNTTVSQMKMFLTRLGENSCAIITGDVTQIDLPNARSSGLVDAKERLSDVDGITFINFTGKDTVRSRIVQRIIDAYEERK
ncbi:MAG: PhoH family protein [Sphaerochaetaceae bacterium]|nr:PhoH family protein [Sphaerochaetaceae bacterium]